MTPIPYRDVILEGRGATERTFTMDEVIDAIKKHWKKEFHQLEDGSERDGYFVAGFVHSALIAAKVKNKNPKEE